METDQKEDRKEGRELISNKGREQQAQGKLKTDRNGQICWMATSSSRGAQNRCPGAVDVMFCSSPVKLF